MDGITIVCFGDSITYGYCAEYGKDYVSLFRAKVKEDFPDVPIAIKNRGVNGESSRAGLKRIDDELKSYNPDLIIMLFGSNDGAYSAWYHVGLEEFSFNYDRIIERSLQSGSKMILITPTPVIEEEDMPFIENSVLVKYCELIKEKAGKYGLPLIDMNSVFNSQPGGLKPLLQWDGQHISTEGYELFFNEVYKTAKPVIEDIINKK
ncbi:MAG: GDSL-type esterase/lipase family protein [Clostridia bacterium]|nr:GDSL-type esterase/lipase family protein [Clostridia bacterium]